MLKKKAKKLLPILNLGRMNEVGVAQQIRHCLNVVSQWHIEPNEPNVEKKVLKKHDV